MKVSEAIKKTIHRKRLNPANEDEPSVDSSSGKSSDLTAAESIEKDTKLWEPAARLPLGRLLLLAASLYEAMDGYTDEKLLDRYLLTTPALHPRRTLDQSYYWALKETQMRDRDQVVYKATSPHRKHSRHACSKESKNSSSPCSQCMANIRKVPRVVMVDQLWMWILDNSQWFLPLECLSQAISFRGLVVEPQNTLWFVVSVY
jgi:hypothetical protein